MAPATAGSTQPCPSQPSRDCSGERPANAHSQDILWYYIKRENTVGKKPITMQHSREHSSREHSNGLATKHAGDLVKIYIIYNIYRQNIVFMHSTYIQTDRQTYGQARRHKGKEALYYLKC